MVIQPHKREDREEKSNQRKDQGNGNRLVARIARVLYQHVDKYQKVGHDAREEKYEQPDIEVSS